MTKFMVISISITRDLKRRMHEIGDGVNWSKTAREAFEKKLQGGEYPHSKKEHACNDCAKTSVCSIFRAVPEDVSITLTQCGARIPWCAVR